MKRILVFMAALAAACGSGGGSDPVDGVTAREDFNGVAAADMNGDGFTDLVTGSFWLRADGSRSAQVVVLLQDAARPGTFGAPRETVSPVTPQEIAATDLQGDGLPDVVASSLAEAGFRVFLNDPAAPGALRPGVHYGAGPAAIGWPKLAVGDLDGDARPDVAVADDTTLAYFPQSAASPGSFLAARVIGAGFEGAATGDIDSDGLVDAATFEGDWRNDIPDALLYYRQSPAVPGQFLPATRVPFGFSGVQVVVADVDADGRSDFAVSGFNIDSSYNLDEKMTVIRQSGQGFLVGPTVSARGRSVGVRLAVADLNGSGIPEIVVCGTQLRIYERTGAGGYALAQSVPVPQEATATCDGVAVADLNHDAQLDVAASMGDIQRGRVYVFFALPGQPGVFGPAVQVAPAP